MRFLTPIVRHSWFRSNFRSSSLSTHVATIDYSNILSQQEFSRVENLFNGLIGQKRASLAESITLVESTHPRKKVQSRMLMELVLKNLKERESNHQFNTFRIGESFFNSACKIGGACYSTKIRRFQSILNILICTFFLQFGDKIYHRRQEP